MRNVLFCLACCLLFMGYGSKLSSPESADLILTNAQVYTVNKKQPSAQAVAIKDGRILFTGSTAEALKFKGANTQVLDCKGQFVMPGFIEGHGHIHGLGSSLRNLNLMNAKNWDEILKMVADAAAKAKPGDWIIGRGWHQEKWDKKPSPEFLGYPYYDQLDKVSPNNPVLLTHASGHSSYANGIALKIAGINNRTKNPTGGDIVKDSEGKLIGVLEETAQQPVSLAYQYWLNKQSPEVLKASWAQSMALAEQECLRYGVTSFSDAGSSFQQVAWMKELAEQNKLNIRHWAMIRDGNASLRKHAYIFPINNAGNGFLTVKAVKVSLDGALGSYGAWLLEPYADRAGWMGQNTFNVDSLNAIADFCWEKDLQLCVHAIGDRANKETIDIFSTQIKKNKSKDHRWRVEHAQHVNPAEIPRFKEWNVIASMQSIHCTSDAPYVPKRLGDTRAKEGAYMWKAFLDAGVVVTNGTDVPVENINPFACYYAAVTRKLTDGSTFYPEQRMTRDQALYSYTMANAYAAFQDKEKGSIEKGKYADIIVLSNNLITCKEEDIRTTRVLYTIVDGKIKFQQ
ncbi:MAG: amidohydrolase [Chitinophagaceae bacterium]|nr:amidohydrolase [Chitinophagaceae bacterium]